MLPYFCNYSRIISHGIVLGRTRGAAGGSVMSRATKKPHTWYDVPTVVVDGLVVRGKREPVYSQQLAG